MNGPDDYLQLTLVASQPWGDQLAEDVVTVAPPPGGSYLEVPGPRARPVRPYLDASAGPGGLAARIIRGDGQVQPRVARVNQTVTFQPVAEPPVAVCARDDGGLWVLGPSELASYDASGTRQFATPATAAGLVGVGNNSVWLVSFESATFVGADGATSRPYPWAGGLNAVADGDNLCTLKKAPRQLTCLSPDGSTQVQDVSPEPGPFEQLLVITEWGLITLSGGTLRRYDGTPQEKELVIQAAGLTDEGVPFASGRAGSEVHLWEGDGAPRRLPLPPDVPELGAFRVVAVSGDRALIYGQDRAFWVEGDHIVDSFTVDESRYRDDVFPQLWSLGTPLRAVGRPDGTLLLSASGPAGVILIALRWQPQTT